MTRKVDLTGAQLKAAVEYGFSRPYHVNELNIGSIAVESTYAIVKSGDTRIVRIVWNHLSTRLHGLTEVFPDYTFPTPKHPVEWKFTNSPTPVIWKVYATAKGRKSAKTQLKRLYGFTYELEYKDVTGFGLELANPVLKVDVENAKRVIGLA